MTKPNERVNYSGAVEKGVHDLTAEFSMPLARLRTNCGSSDDTKVHGNGNADSDEELLQRAQWWARLFGIDHWRIGITTGAEDRQLGETSTARVRCSDHYDEAIIMIRGARPSSGLYSSDALAYPHDQSLIHEFLHVVFREMDVTIEDALQLIADDKAREVIQGRMTMRQEQIVERLTQILATLVRSLGCQPDMQAPLSSGSIVVDHGILENPTFYDKSYKPESPEFE